MKKINERILNADDLKAEDDEKKEAKKETRKAKNMNGYGDLLIPKAWKNPPKFADLKSDIEQASLEHAKQINRINGYLDFYHTTGIGRPAKEVGRSNAQPQLIRKAAEWRYSHLSEPFLDSPKLFKASAATEFDIEGSKQSGIVLNHQMNYRINKVTFVDNYVKDLVDIGTAIIRTAWEFEEIERQVEQEVVRYVENDNPKLEQSYGRLILLMEQDPAAFKKTVPPEVAITIRKSMEQNKILQREVIKTEMATVREVVKNHPSLEVCDYRDVIPDPTCKGVEENMMFCGFKLRTTVADLLKDPRYSSEQVEKINVTPAIMADRSENLNTRSTGEVRDQDDASFTFADSSRQPIEGIEYWGKIDVHGDGALTPVVFTWFGDVLVRAEENPFPDKKIPFNFVPYLKRRNSLYGEPDGVLLEEDQKVSGAITRGVIDILAKNASGQRGVPKGALDYSNNRLYKAGKDYEFNSNAQIGRDGLAQITKFPEIPQSALQIKMMSEAAVNEMSGTEPGAGSASHGAAVGTATENSAPTLSKAARRELSILRRMVNGVVTVGMKICSMNQEFLEDEEIVRITDNEFVSIRREDLECNYDLSLSISTAEDDQAKASELSFMLQTAASTMDDGFVRQILGDIAELRRMPDKAAQYRNYQPQPDPHAERVKELEIAKLEREIKEIESRIGENEAERNREQATANKYNEEAGLAKAKADAINLKYVEDQSGTTHERDVNKIKAQSEGNINLETHKANLEAAKPVEPEKPIPTQQSNLTDPGNTSKTAPQSNKTIDQITEELDNLGSLDELLAEPV